MKRYNPHIIELDLTSNRLTTLTDEIAELKFLRVLRVKYNELKTVPPVVLLLNQLSHLDLAGNQISVLPEGLGEVHTLREINLSGNRLTKLIGAVAPCIPSANTTRSSVCIAGRYATGTMFGSSLWHPDGVVAC